ncbi:MAG TPA: alpha amylase C-terminal domain-containing protein [Candidatus Faecousia faecavium]|nr:alpha amylase C-terminal domain-containing protein [Candidatus Faecousia faecavium]
MYRILELNPQLKPFAGDIDLRMFLYHSTKGRLLNEDQTLLDFANAYNYYGFHHVDGGWYYREWAPSAYQLYLEGDFNGWNKTSHPLKHVGNGNWELYLEGDDALWEGCKVKTVVDANMTRTEHIPLYARRVVQDPKTITFACEVVDDRDAFAWTDQKFVGEEELYIYEAHVGMAQEAGKIGTYREFANKILPQIKKAGYNTVQLMAIMEHPYYGSFGYQVSSFYAASSWFGKPKDLKYLVNKAHKLGLRVLLDVVHSHAVKNTTEGINMFDGTTWQFFHDGPKGDHPAWDTKCFDYGKTGVLHFLLSNLKFWMTEYHFDGFRFDGVTSMLYHDHGLGTDFNTNDKYFSYNTHTEAITYLQLANELIRQVNPKAITIAEDMSGMPGMCLPIEDGGIGFDYRLGMGLPDMWIKTVKEKKDEDWNIGQMWGDMCLRRPGENTVAYVESHDQALVGDKTMIFRLADAAMYTDMDKATHNPVIDRAIALHKMIRLFTLGGGGEAYLNFMGNEFGHPEWIDFPREGNGWSFHYCRRQWSLKENGYLKYQWLNDFDEDMVKLTKENHMFTQRMADLLLLKEPEKTIVFYRHGLLFALNFHPSQSLTNVLVPVPQPGEYTVALCSDDEKYGGQNLVAHMVYPTKMFDGKHYVELYIPARTAIVLKERVILPEDVQQEAAKPAAKRTFKKAAENSAEKKAAPKKRSTKAVDAEPEKKPTRKRTAKAAETEKKPTRKRTSKKAQEQTDLK